MRLTSTRDAGVDRLKIVVYGPAGAGKTRLAATTGDPQGTVIVSAEAGLLSLRGEDIDAIEVNGRADLAEAYKHLRRNERGYRWIIVDSISELAEVCLGEEKKASKDPRAAYGQMAEAVTSILRAFRDLPYHVIFTAKQDRTQTEAGAMLYGPSMPGKQLGPAVGYLVDEMFALRVMRADDGTVERHLQTGPDGVYDAKDRSGALSHREPADLAAIAAKILGTRPIASPVSVPSGAPTVPDTSTDTEEAA